MTDNTKKKFFNDIADWDDCEDLELLAQELDEGLDKLEVSSGETILDTGCGR